MIYSIKNDFVFVHCPRTSGTSLTKALSILVPDAVVDVPQKHFLHHQLPRAVQGLRAFTILRPLHEVRESYFRYITKWFRESADNTCTTLWLFRHAERLSNMSLEQYMQSDEPPVDVDCFADGCQRVFHYHDEPYHDIADYCGVDRGQLTQLVNMFRGLTK